MNNKLNELKEEGYRLMGAAFEVYKEQGGGLLEEIYQESIEIELELREIPFSSKEQLNVFYKDRPLKTKYIPDMIAFVELKSVKALLPEHEAQLLNYMKITRKAVGYLINFGPIVEVEWKRFILSENLKNYFNSNEVTEIAKPSK